MHYVKNKREGIKLHPIMLCSFTKGLGRKGTANLPPTFCRRQSRGRNRRLEILPSAIIFQKKEQTKEPNKDFLFRFIHLPRSRGKWKTHTKERRTVSTFNKTSRPDSARSKCQLKRSLKSWNTQEYNTGEEYT